jgi:beta-glucanase (GH16 family)
LRLHTHCLAILCLAGCGGSGDAPAPHASAEWQVDFFDDFDRFEPDNWQDQLLWVNDEDQCYVPDGEYGTREIGAGTLKIKVVALDEPIECGNRTKTGVTHPPTRYVAARIASKNRQEFVKGRWTARLRVPGSGTDGMFPAWWLLGARNNEPPTEEADENVCWPVTGSGELDIFEHHSDGGPDHYAARIIHNPSGECGDGDWKTYMTVLEANLAEFHEYSVEWEDGDVVFRQDGRETYRLPGRGDDYPEPLFAILNFAKINDADMSGEWVMEVDWVKHESRR